MGSTIPKIIARGTVPDVWICPVVSHELEWKEYTVIK